MADNWLEKKMEEHARNRGAYIRHTPQPQHCSGCVSLPVSVKLVHLHSVAPIPEEPMMLLGRRLRSADCRVAFTCTDTTVGTRLAQAESWIFVPQNAILPAKFGTPDAHIYADTTGTLSILFTTGRQCRIEPAPTAAMVNKALFLCLVMSEELDIRCTF